MFGWRLVYGSVGNGGFWCEGRVMGDIRGRLGVLERSRGGRDSFLVGTFFS